MITILGDSFSTGYLIEDSYVNLLKENYEVQNISFDGIEMGNLISYKSKIKGDFLIVFAGLNDILSGVSCFRLKDYLDEIKQGHENMLVITPPLIEEEDIYPIYERVNWEIRDYERLVSKEYNCIKASNIQKPTDYLDGVHLKMSFHNRLFDSIMKKLKEMDYGKCDE